MNNSSRKKINDRLLKYGKIMNNNEMIIS